MFQTPRPSNSKQPIPPGMAGMPGILGPVPSPHLLRTPRTPVRARDPFSMMHTDPGKGTHTLMILGRVINFIIHMFNIECLNLDKKLLLFFDKLVKQIQRSRLCFPAQMFWAQLRLILPRAARQGLISSERGQKIYLCPIT